MSYLNNFSFIVSSHNSNLPALSIYEKYAKYSTRGIALFTIFTILWALYGVAALMPYTLKNIGYNILDIFSKNFFGLFLVYIALFE